MSYMTPSEVFYDELRRNAHINNREAARLILSDSAEDGKLAPRLKVTDKTFLSRRIVHVTPGKDRIDLNTFRAFENSVPDLATAIAIKTENRLVTDSPETRRILHASIAHMARALDAWGADGNILQNTIEWIAGTSEVSLGTRFLLGLMAFTVCGCLADSSKAAENVRDFAANKLGTTFSTTDTTCRSSTTRVRHGRGKLQLGLLRVGPDGTALSQIYKLSSDPGGTVIGAFAQGPSTVTDVGFDVSREHLRIERIDGEWVARGLGSTNGSILYRRGESARVIEMPAKISSPETVHTSVPIQAGDELMLGRSTRFLVMGIDFED